MGDEKPTFIEWIKNNLRGITEFYKDWNIFFGITLFSGLPVLILSLFYLFQYGFSYEIVICVCLTLLIITYSYYQLSWDYVPGGGD